MRHGSLSLSPAASAPRMGLNSGLPACRVEGEAGMGLCPNTDSGNVCIPLHLTQPNSYCVCHNRLFLALQRFALKQLALRHTFSEEIVRLTYTENIGLMHK